jgi:Fic family protein
MGQISMEISRPSGSLLSGNQHYYTHPDQLDEALSEWLSFTMATDPRTPELLRQLCSHWMFESIHPVMDGNGRIGRLLIPLVMKWKGATRSGSAFIGEAVHADKDLYIDALKDVRRSGDFAPWCNIALSFIRQTAESNIERLDKLSAISASWSEQLAGTRRDSVLHRMVPWMLTKPAFTVKHVGAELGVTFAVANNAVQVLVDKKIVSLAGSGSRNRLFLAPDVLDAFDRFRRTA